MSTMIPGKRGEAVQATCQCGHVGKSNYPEHYRCTVCYYTAKAKGELNKAEVLESRAAVCREDAARYQAEADAALKRRQDKKP